jgi:hypothetical protein
MKKRILAVTIAAISSLAFMLPANANVVVGRVIQACDMQGHWCQNTRVDQYWNGNIFLGFGLAEENYSTQFEWPAPNSIAMIYNTQTGHVLDQKSCVGCTDPGTVYGAQGDTNCGHIGYWYDTYNPSTGATLSANQGNAC